MMLSRLSLIHFRNHRELLVDFDSKTTVILGQNAAGKTNVLEAIYLLAMGASFRDGKIEEMVNWNAEVGHVSALLRKEILRQSGSSHLARSAQDDKIDLKSLSSLSNKGQEEIQLRVTVTRGMVQGKRVSKRRLFVNGVGRSRAKFVGNLICVVFRPEDLRIVEGSPGRRRKFLDEVLSQVDGEYVRCLSAYNRALVRRNKILQMIREGKTQRSALYFWDQTVIKNGEYVQRARREMCQIFNDQSSMINEIFMKDLMIEYDDSVMSEKRLKQYEMQEVAAGHTLVGPHRDDFRIVSGDEETVGREGRDLAVYGSRGEQRLGVLWLKLKALDFMERKVGERPMLLLDDIFSELDHEHRELVFGLLGKQQTVVSSADRHYVEGIEGKVVEIGGTKAQKHKGSKG